MSALALRSHSPEPESPSTPPEPAPFDTLDMQSVYDVCNESDQVMVYGWQHCCYRNVAVAIFKETLEEDGTIKKFFCPSVGNPGYVKVNTEVVTTLEGRRMNVIGYAKTDDAYHDIARKCKTALTNIVLENMKRIQEKLPVIPVLFCIDIDDNPKPLSIENLCSKQKNMNRQITHKELRRAYKLCTHENPTIRQAAAETFRFVKLAYWKEEGTYFLKQIAAPWDSPKFASSWSARKKQSTSKPKPAETNWRKSLDKEVSKYKAASAPIAPKARTPSELGRDASAFALALGNMASSQLPSLFFNVTKPLKRTD